MVPDHENAVDAGAGAHHAGADPDPDVPPAEMHKTRINLEEENTRQRDTKDEDSHRQADARQPWGRDVCRLQ